MSTTIERAAEVIRREVRRSRNIADDAADQLDAAGLLVDADTERLAARLAEAEEKIAYLQQGCMNMTRDELIQKITEVGSERWQSGHWITEQRRPLIERIAELEAQAAIYAEAGVTTEGDGG